MIMATITATSQERIKSRAGKENMKKEKSFAKTGSVSPNGT